MFWKWAKEGLKEVLNFLLNVLVPVVSILVTIAEVVPFVPAKAVMILKKAEYFMFNAFGTAKDLEKRLQEKEKETEKKYK